MKIYGLINCMKIYGLITLYEDIWVNYIVKIYEDEDIWVNYIV